MYSTIHSPAAIGGLSLARRVVCALTGAFALTFASGCALLSDNLEKAASGAGKLVKSYCENVTIPEVRQQIRDAVNAKAAPHKIEVICADELPAAAPAAPDPNAALIAPLDAFQPDAAAALAWNWRAWLDRLPIIIIERE